MKHFKLNESIPGDQFEWPEYKDDKSRIKAYSSKFKNKSVTDAFQEVYGENLKNVSEKANELPREYRVGDIIPTRIPIITKGSAIFEDVNFKGNIVSAVNLYKYEKLRGGIHTPVMAMVMDVKKDKITLDPIRPFTDSWISSIIGNPISQNVIGSPKFITVKNLHLTNGGFTGKAVIPSTSEFVGEDVTIDAFIPGSQIVLNITDNFEQFEGKNVQAFVLNYVQKDNGMSLICSRKALLTFLGNCSLIDIFNRWCEGSSEWDQYSKIVYSGCVTGVLNSSKKCGVFVEIPELNITGMVKVAPEDLVNYKPGNKVGVHLSSFDEEVYYNKDVQQIQHVMPYVIEDGVLVKCNLKPILEFVDNTTTK